MSPAEPVIFSRLRDDNVCVFALGGHRLRLRDRPTSAWLSALGNQALHEIMPGMLKPRDMRWYVSQLADSYTAFDVADSHKVTHAVVQAVCGIPWWAAVRLANALGRSWFLADPSALLRGVNLLDLPIRRTLACTYVFAAESCKDDKERAALDIDLFRPPEGFEDKVSAVQQAASFAAFRTASAMFRPPGVRAGTPG